MSIYSIGKTVVGLLCPLFKAVQVYDLNAMSNSQRLQVAGFGDGPESLDFSPDGSKIAVSGNYYAGTSLVDLKSGKASSRGTFKNLFFLAATFGLRRHR